MATRPHSFRRALATPGVRVALDLIGLDYQEYAIDLPKGEPFSVRQSDAFARAHALKRIDALRNPSY